jgi:hypothetical protein
VVAAAAQRPRGSRSCFPVRILPKPGGALQEDRDPENPPLTGTMAPPSHLALKILLGANQEAGTQAEIQGLSRLWEITGWMLL